VSELAHEIVDNLVEGMFSDEEMAGFADAAGYIFHWFATPDGVTNCQFKILKYRTTGEIYMKNDGPTEGTDRAFVRFSVNLHVDSPQRAANDANSRLKTQLVRHEGELTLRKDFEEFIRGPISALLAKGRLTNHTLAYQVTKFCSRIAWKPKGGLASPEEVKALELRFDLGASRGVYRYDWITDDPRTQGRETDYQYMTSDDVRFWNTLADEYAARKS